MKTTTGMKLNQDRLGYAMADLPTADTRRALSEKAAAKLAAYEAGDFAGLVFTYGNGAATHLPLIVDGSVYGVACNSQARFAPNSPSSRRVQLAGHTDEATCGSCRKAVQA